MKEIFQIKNIEKKKKKMKKFFFKKIRKIVVKFEIMRE